MVGGFGIASGRLVAGAGRSPCVAEVFGLVEGAAARAEGLGCSEGAPSCVGAGFAGAAWCCAAGREGGDEGRGAGGDAGGAVGCKAGGAGGDAGGEARCDAGGVGGDAGAVAGGDGGGGATACTGGGLGGEAAEAG
jgi:hypothetical protein